MKPTLDFYAYLQSAFDFFNERLFENKLSPVIFTITRKTNVCGYFRKDGWSSEDGKLVHEIAINPAYFITASPLELYQTICHEQVHQFQHSFGTPSRGGYHNTEWADKMRSIGLEPISANGKGTGQKVGDKPIPNGAFEQACKDFFKAGYRLALVDRQYNTNTNLKRLNEVLESRINGNLSEGIDAEEMVEGELDLSLPITEFFEVIEPEIKPTSPIKTCYQCVYCDFKVWGKLGLNLNCLDCGNDLIVAKEGN